MDGDDGHGRQGQEGDVEPEKPRQGGLGDSRPAQNDPLQPAPDERKGSGDVRPDPGGGVGQLVPGQEVAAEAEGQEKDKEEKPGNPGQLPGLAVGLQEEG